MRSRTETTTLSRAPSLHDRLFPFPRLHWPHRPMPHMQDVHTFINHHEKKSISSPIPRSKQQFAYGLIKRTALRSQRTSFRMMRKSLDTLPRPSNPIARGPRRMLANVPIRHPQIHFCLGSDNHPVRHRSLQPSRSSSLNTSSTGCPSPLFAWARPRRILATVSS